jgi:polysaccharide biosynthesis transport protein
MEGSSGTQLDPRSLFQALWRRKWLFLAIFLSIPAAVYLISTQVPKTYEASALIRTQTSNLEVPGVASPSLSSTGSEALLVDTQKVAKAAAREMEWPPSRAGSLAGSVQADPVTTSSGGETDLLQITAQADTADRASAVANAYASAVDTVRTKQKIREIDRAMEKLQAESAEATDEATQFELARQLQLLRAARAAEETSTETVVAATPPGTQISPAPRRNTALAAVVSLLLALGAVALRERTDRRIRDPNELEPLLGTPLLSVIPRSAFPGARPAHAPVREAFRTLAASLVYFNIDRPLAAVMVSSPTKGDGKTTVAVHLATALAKDGQTVVLVDGDLRHPQVAVWLGIEPAAGLTEVITKQADLRDALVDVDVGDGRLRVLAAGSRPPNPARLLSSKRMTSLLVALSEQADIVILDTPPILNVSDAVPLLETVSGTVLVAKVDSTTREALQRVRQVIETAHGNLLGIVATGAGGAGLYGYGADYYDDDRDEDAEVSEPARDGVGPAASASRTRQASGRRERVSPAPPEREDAR